MTDGTHFLLYNKGYHMPHLSPLYVTLLDVFNLTVWTGIQSYAEVRQTLLQPPLYQKQAK